jgi:DNA repair protein RadC
MNKSGIHNWPVSERPREVLLKKGAPYVSDAGLLAISLRSGLKGADAVTFSRKLLQKFGGLAGIINADKSELEKIKGLGPAKIATLLSLKEIVSRVSKEKLINNPSFKKAEDAFDYLKASMKGLKKEVFKAIYLDNSNKVIDVEDLFQGTVNQSAVYPREVIEKAMARRASKIIFAHNHPSGCLKPTKDDIEITKKLYKACKAVEITPLDHLIIAGNRFNSINEFINHG